MIIFCGIHEKVHYDDDDDFEMGLMKNLWIYLLTNCL